MVKAEGRRQKAEDSSHCLRYCQVSNCRFLGSIYGRGPGFAGAVWDKNYLSPTLTTMQGGNREPMIVVRE